MKAIIAAAIMALGAAQSDAVELTDAEKQACMNCKNSDMTAGFLYSFNYCPASNTCVADQWNKFNAWCFSPWKPGYTLDLAVDC